MYHLKLFHYIYIRYKHFLSGKADAIKTHHNDSELVRALRAQGHVVEPLKDFHKDEVRQLGCDLGLPAPLVARHPYPGPGLAVRILCAVEPYMDKDFSETQVRHTFEIFTNGRRETTLACSCYRISTLL